MQAISTAMPLVAAPAPPQGLLRYATEPAKDSVSLSSSVRAGGAIGAASGAAVGRLLLPTTGAVGAGTLAGIALSALPAIGPAPIGIGLAAVAGLIGGIALEAKTGAGRLVGGLIGSAAGTAAGAAAGVAGWRPSEPLAKLTDSFELKSLPNKLLDRDHSAYPSLRHNPEAVEALKSALPGDIIAVHEENIFEGAAFMTKLAGARADYTHLGIVTERGTIIDMVETGAHERKRDLWLRFSHMAILRPQYATADAAWNTVEGARRAIDEKTYDDDLKLDNDPKLEYCTEFVANRLKENAPEIELGEQHFFKKRFITPDVFFDSRQVDVAYDSGSNFWLNHLSRVC